MEIFKSYFRKFRSKIRNKRRIPKNVELQDTKIASGNFEIGEYTKFNGNCEIHGHVRIGKYCAIARNVVFMGQNHSYSRPSMQGRFYREILNSELPTESKGGIEIGNDVWIGTNAVILPGVSIGDGAIVGAGSIVTGDVEKYEIVGGNPADHISWRFDKDTREFLQDLEWWNWTKKEILDNKEFFETDIENKKIGELNQLISHKNL